MEENGGIRGALFDKQNKLKTGTQQKDQAEVLSFFQSWEAGQ